MFTAQIYYYWLTYEDDSPFLRHYVSILWYAVISLDFTISILIRLVCRLLEIAHTVLCVQIIYHYLIIHFGNTDSGLDRIVWYVAHT